MRELRLRPLCYVIMAAVLTISIGLPILAADAAQTNVNLDLKDTDVKAAIEALFRGTGRNYSIDSNVSGIVSALSIKDVPFETALRSLTKSAGLVYRQDGGVYLISVKPDTSNLVAASMPISELPSVDATTDEPEIKIEKIPLNNVSANEILSILGGTDSNRAYGGYGMGGWNYGMGMGGRYGGSGGYGSYGGNYGGNYGGYGNYGSYGNRSYGGNFGGYGSNYGGYGSNYGGYNNRSSGYGGSYGGSYGGYRGW